MVKTILAIACVLIVASAMRVNLSHDYEQEDFREGRVTIQADNGKYLTRCNNCSAKYADSAILEI
jgi:hypothetical protein